MRIPIRIREDPWRDEELMWMITEKVSYRDMAQEIGKSLGTVQQGLVLLQDKHMIEPTMIGKRKYWKLTEKGTDKMRSFGYELQPTGPAAN
jgi:Mn-dependent DtxR family transcriptional regulator